MWPLSSWLAPTTDDPADCDRNESGDGRHSACDDCDGTRVDAGGFGVRVADDDVVVVVAAG